VLTALPEPPFGSQARLNPRRRVHLILESLEASHCLRGFHQPITAPEQSFIQITVQQEVSMPFLVLCRVFIIMARAESSANTSEFSSANRFE
jgi:hypothetical protein